MTAVLSVFVGRPVWVAMDRLKRFVKGRHARHDAVQAAAAVEDVKSEPGSVKSQDSHSSAGESSCSSLHTDDCLSTTESPRCSGVCSGGAAASAATAAEPAESQPKKTVPAVNGDGAKQVAVSAAASASATPVASSSPPARGSSKKSSGKPSGKSASADKTISEKSHGPKRLLREFQDIVKRGPSYEIQCQLVDDNLLEWDVSLSNVMIDSDSHLYRDMKETGVVQIELRLSFPERYPFKPPFVRVVKPYINGGYVMEGGAICMELLTSDGWSGAYTAESILRQFTASLVQGRARLSRSGKNKVPYSKANAEHSFKMLVKVHQSRGWYTPPKAKG